MAALTFGAFPRSGGHFFTHLTGCKWLAHSICALEEEQNVVVSVRSPLECIPSWIVLTGDEREDRAEKVLEWYRAYYKKCQQLDIVIIPFSQLISEPLFCINYALRSYGLEPLQELQFDLSTNFHDPTRDKSGYGEIIAEMTMAPSFQPALELFEDLCRPISG